ncbi:hypothetical protein [Romboutsia lituseburensis]|uniref:hypothetical protein n=1 Tax=Romboutsia lituseburensis TaxID=1537 RepID=UPI0022EAB97A|nr:hypothetical protein [Romboutsia lituseburensis]
MIIKIYVNNKLMNVCISEFAAMNNMATYRELYGKENVRVERVANQSFEDAMKECSK